MKSIEVTLSETSLAIKGLKADAGIFDLIAIGCSAGGVESLRTLLPIVKEQFPASVVVIQHRSADSPQILQNYFSLICNTQVQEPDDKQPIQKGVIYFAPTNYHLLIDDHRNFNLSIDPLVNYSRPSIDVFFESAAQVFGPRMLGIILSGANQDGALGLKAVADHGGSVLVQDPQTAEYKEMPKAAVAHVTEQSIVTVEQIRNYFSELGSAVCKK